VRDDIQGLAVHTTLHLGGAARRVVQATDEQEIMQIVRDADRAQEPILILAGGSNLVIGDDGFDGTALLLSTRGISAARDGDHIRVTVAAGEPWDAMVARSIEEKWSGLECLSGIPGSTGATPIQNVGAYGQEVAERIASVRAWDRETGNVVTMLPAECRFGYRTSVFKHVDRWVVLSVDFRLTRSEGSAPIRYAELARALDVEAGDLAGATEVRDAVLRLRRSKGMVLDPADPDTASAGSFFTNPVLSASAYAAFAVRASAIGPVPAWPERDGGMKISAAWLIEKAGFSKGYGHGGVSISTKHTLALTNRGDGTTAQLLDLAREIRAGVDDRFGVELHPEPVLVNCAL
jgi:UDP-N-acetylmuramate dehydrogenase